MIVTNEEIKKAAEAAFSSDEPSYQILLSVPFGKTA